MVQEQVDYDQIAHTYDRRYGAQGYEGVASTVLSLARSGAAHSVLEVGCGTGHWLAQLRGVCPEVYGLDLSLAMLRQAEQKQQPFLVTGQADRLPFVEASFDFVFCVSAFHHFADKREFLSQARRSLRSGGRLAIIGMDPHRADHTWSLYDYFEGTRQADLARYPSAHKIETWMREAGFVEVESGIAEQMRHSLSGRGILESPFLEKEGTSQLALLSDEVYQSGLERLKVDVRRAEKTGKPLEFQVHITLTLVTGSAP